MNDRKVPGLFLDREYLSWINKIKAISSGKNPEEDLKNVFNRTCKGMKRKFKTKYIYLE